jgi:ABC-type siderophore export system fused ATPase/permease subunit
VAGVVVVVVVAVVVVVVVVVDVVVVVVVDVVVVVVMAGEVEVKVVEANGKVGGLSKPLRLDSEQATRLFEGVWLSPNMSASSTSSGL